MLNAVVFFIYQCCNNLWVFGKNKEEKIRQVIMTATMEGLSLYTDTSSVPMQVSRSDLTHIRQERIEECKAL